MPKFSTPDYAPLPHYDVLTVIEIAASLRVSAQTIYNEIHRGHLKACVVGGLYRVLRADYLAWQAGAFPSPLRGEGQGEGDTSPPPNGHTNETKQPLQPRLFN